MFRNIKGLVAKIKRLEKIRFSAKDSFLNNSEKMNMFHAIAVLLTFCSTAILCLFRINTNIEELELYLKSTHLPPS